MDSEKIYCAAIWYQEIIPTHDKELRNPNNVNHGVVVIGHRHPDIIKNVYNLLGKRTVSKGENSCGNYIQGFITTKNRFVDRKEGADIAWREKQILNENTSNKKYLFSEDIY